MPSNARNSRDAATRSRSDDDRATTTRPHRNANDTTTSTRASSTASAAAATRIASPHAEIVPVSLAMGHRLPRSAEIRANPPRFGAFRPVERDSGRALPSIGGLGQNDPPQNASKRLCVLICALRGLRSGIYASWAH